MTGKPAAKKAPTRTARRPAAKESVPSKTPVLLTGGNPQIAKADGDAPVQQYIAAMPDWKRDVGRQLDALVVRAVPKVKKAVRWNSPFYGVDGEGWFLSLHCYTKYVQVAFLNGSALQPLPPKASKHPNVRYLDIHQDEPIDERQFTAWLKQASRLPGDPLF